jgi:dihydroxy-acid dehydratase
MGSNYENIPDKPRYVDFPSLEHGTIVDGKQALNRWSSTITKAHDFPGAQVRRTCTNKESEY